MAVNVGLPMFPMVQFDMSRDAVENYYRACGATVEQDPSNPGMSTISGLPDSEGMVMWETNREWEGDVEVDEAAPGGPIRYRLQD